MPLVRVCSVRGDGNPANVPSSPTSSSSSHTSSSPPTRRLTQPERTTLLRTLLADQSRIIQGPCCHDGISARLIEDAGFDFAFLSGFSTVGAKLAAPDAGLISYGEVLDVGRCVYEATARIPVIGDGDTAYSNAVNAMRTVRGFAQAGFAGILIEDQVSTSGFGFEGEGVRESGSEGVRE